MERSADDKLELALLRRQDHAAFARFVRNHERIVLGLCQSLGLPRADRDDAAAETFAQAYRSLPSFRGESELGTWLYRIAYRTVLKVRHSRPRTPGPRINAPQDINPGAITDPAERPDEAAAANEAYERLWAAAAKLDPDQSAAVELYYRREMSVEQVAAVLEKPAGTIKTLLFRAREQLRIALESLEQVP